MDSPNISIRIRRHETLPCPRRRGCTHARTHGNPGTPRKGPGQSSSNSNSHHVYATASVLISRRLGSTKNNPYVGSFRHAPPTSLRSMEASSLPSLTSRTREGSAVFLSPSLAWTGAGGRRLSSVSSSSSVVPAMKNSPYVGWFRHAPPSFSSYHYLQSSASACIKNTSKAGSSKGSGTTAKTSKKPCVVQHKVNSESLMELDRWHHQLTSLLLGVGNDHPGKDTEKPTPLLLGEIINGRLLGGSGKDHGCPSGATTGNNNSIIQQCNNNYRPHESRPQQQQRPLPLMSASEMVYPAYNAVLSRLTSWLLFPLIYADDECYNDYGSLNGDHYSRSKNNNTSGGLKFLLSSTEDDRSIEIDSDENDDDDDYSSVASSVDYDPCGESVPSGVTKELEQEFTEVNVSVSEIAETYYAHKLIDERRNRSNSDATTTSQQSGLSRSYDTGEETQQRLDYEITQMDIARMTRNASRHLDVDSILKLPTIMYRKKRRPPPSSQSPASNSIHKQQQQRQDQNEIPPCEQSYHHICTPIREDSSDSGTHGGDGSSIIHVNNANNDEMVVSEDGWSFMMVSGVKAPAARNCLNCDDAVKSTGCLPLADGGEEDTATTASGTDDTCVICLEAFKEGDRLRVLPCNHSFHVGCIDRWLSGSHSHNECFTAGCPTCKKRPSVLLPSSSSSSLEKSVTEIMEAEQDLSDSLPSWAFTNLGSIMAMSPDGFS